MPEAHSWEQSSLGKRMLQEHEEQTRDSSENKRLESQKWRRDKISFDLEEIKAIALDDIGLEESSVIFTKEKLDTDSKEVHYDIEFYSETHEYDYEVNALSGVIMEKSSKLLKSAFNNSKSDRTVPLTAASSTADLCPFIDVDEAKLIAAEHAGLEISSVFFSKAKLDDDDGKKQYKIRFYVGETEYKYEIDAYNGTVIEYSVKTST